MPIRTNRKIATNTLEWIGKGTIDDGKVFYSKCKFNGFLINCGDDVIINGNKDQSFVGHVEKLYELEEAEDPNRAIIQWYYTHGELSKLTRKITVDIPEPWRELFLPSEDVCNHSIEDVDAETISRKCTVLRLKPQDIVPDCLQKSSREDLYYVRYKFDQNYSLHPVSKRLSRKSILDSKENVERRTNRVGTPNCTPRRLDNTVKTSQAKKTPAKEKVADNSSVKTNNKTPKNRNKSTVANKCMVPIEPLVFNGDSVVPVKRRASRSIPDESEVTPKRSKGHQYAKKTKEPMLSPRQRYGTVEVLEQVLESESRCSDDGDDSDDESVFNPSGVSDLSDNDDDADDDEDDDVWEVEDKSKTRTQGTRTPARTLRSSSKSQSAFTAIKDTPKGKTTAKTPSRAKSSHKTPQKTPAPKTMKTPRTGCK